MVVGLVQTKLTGGASRRRRTGQAGGEGCMIQSTMLGTDHRAAAPVCRRAGGAGIVLWSVRNYIGVVPVPQANGVLHITFVSE